MLFFRCRLPASGACSFSCCSFPPCTSAAGFTRRNSMATDPPSFRQRLTQAAIGTFILVAGLGSYLAVLKWRGPAARIVTQTSWDLLIAFQPGWLWVYVAPYPLAPVILGMMRRSTFHWFIK